MTALIATLVEMQPSEVSCAVATAVSLANSLALSTDDAIVLNSSNKLTLRLLPCDVLARVAPADQQVAQFEVDLALRLIDADCPVAAPEPRVAPVAELHRSGRLGPSPDHEP